MRTMYTAVKWLNSAQVELRNDKVHAAPIKANHLKNLLSWTSL